MDGRSESPSDTKIRDRTPSSVFAPYGNAENDRMAGELAIIFAKIAADATR